jgi:hypothetical protein
MKAKINIEFAEIFWSKIMEAPLGTLAKREIELHIIEAAIQSELIQDSPHEVARTFRISLTKSHSLLTAIALRKEELSDVAALSALKNILLNTEITSEMYYLNLPINNALLRIWLERKMSLLRLNPGESLRRDLVKLTPFSLLKLLQGSDAIFSPYESLKGLPKEYQDLVWFRQIKSSLKEDMTWGDALQSFALNAVGSNIPFIIHLFRAAIG